MVEILIFGTGESAEKLLLNIRRDKVSIIGFIDNDPKKWEKTYYEKSIYPTEKIRTLKFDYIVIASINYEMIVKQLIKIGVSEEKILPYFSFKHEKYDFYRTLFYTEGMVYDELTNRLNDLYTKFENIEYEIADKIEKNALVRPYIKSIEETITEIKEKKLSISRYGDGEFDLIFGKKLKFQEMDQRLADRLAKILINPVNGHIVGLADVYGSLEELREKDANFYRRRLIKERSKQYELLDMNRDYYNAFITRIYSGRTDREKAADRFKMMKEIWEQKDVVIVEGDKTRLGIGNDLFENTANIKRILCPNENAFRVYDKILNACTEFSKDKLFIIALGPTATVLAYDLAKEGYQALDIGHLDIEYEWFLRKIEKDKPVIKGKYTNEVAGGSNVEEIFDEKYEREIEKIIKDE